MNKSRQPRKAYLRALARAFNLPASFVMSLAEVIKDDAMLAAECAAVVEDRIEFSAADWKVAA